MHMKKNTVSKKNDAHLLSGLRKTKAESLTRVNLRLLLLIVVALLALIGCYIFGMVENQKIVENYIVDTARLYVDQINRDLNQIDSELFHVAVNDSDIGKLPDDFGPEDGNCYELLTIIRDKMKLMGLRYREVQFFFVYARDPGTLITDTGGVFRSSPVKIPMNRELMALLEEDDCADSRYVDWTLIEAEGESYAVGYCTRKGKRLGCVIKLTNLLSQLQKTVKNNYTVVPFLKTSDNSIHCLDETMLEAGEQGLYEFQVGDIGRLYLKIVSGQGITDSLKNMQILLLLMLLILLFFFAMLVSTYVQRIVMPVRSIVDGLDKLEEEGIWEFESGKTGGLLELHSVNGKIKELLDKIRSLRITLYEKELNEQQTELEFMQEQMKPHFFINCLSVIHGIADIYHMTEIVGITELLSDYMRHAFLTDEKEYLLSEELAYIQTYIKIQKLRYGEEAFHFEMMVDEDTLSCKIPFLLLQILVENAIVHGITLDDAGEISLYVTTERKGEERYLYICVSDTGRGFSSEILQALETGDPIVYNGRKHVGLQNIRKRLFLLYGKKAEISFFNLHEKFGAVVEVRIPFNSPSPTSP